MRVFSFLRLFFALVALVGFFQGCSRHSPQKSSDTSVEIDASLSRDADYQEFREAVQAEKMQQAYEKATLLTVRFSQNAGAWSCKGFAADRMNKLEEAYENYRKAVSLDPHYAKAWFNLGVISGRLKKRAEEISCYEKAVEVRPDYYKAWANLFSAYTEAGNSQKAIAAFQHVRQLYPRFDRESQELAAQNPTPSPETAQTFRFDERIALPRETEHRLNWNDGEVASAVLVERNARGLSLVKPMAPPGADPVRTEQAQKNVARLFNNRGMVAEERERWDEAIVYYRLAVQKLPQEPMVWNNLGLAQIGGGKFEDAIHSFKEAMKYSTDASLESNLAVAHAAFGAQLVAQGRDLEAMSHFHQALAIQPNMTEPRVGLLSVLRRREKWDEVRSQGQILIDAGQESANLWYTMALAARALNHRPETIKALEQAIRLRPDDPAQWHWYGVEQAQAENFAKASEAFEQVLKFDPKNTEARFALGAAEARLQHWSRALPLLKAVASSDGSLTHRQTLAAAYEASGDPASAVKEYRALLKSQPADAGLMRLLADSLASSRQMNEAIAMYRKSLSLKQDSQTWVGLGYALQENGKFVESRDAYQQAVKQGANSSEIWNNLGVAHARLKEYPEALDAFSKAAQGRSKDSELLYNIGMVFHDMGKKAEVQRTYQTLLQVDKERAKELAAVLQSMN